MFGTIDKARLVVPSFTRLASADESWDPVGEAALTHPELLARGQRSVASAHHWLGMDARGKSDVIGLVTHYGVIERLFGRRVHHGAVLRVACNLDGTVRSIEEVRSLT